MDCPSTSKVGKIREPVTAAGSSWIICRSKSHAGHIYYFNTLTGQAAWNLSEAEISKAKTSTNILVNQQGTNIEDFPEPKESPSEQPVDENVNNNQNTTSVSSKIYNKQIIHNQFPKSNFPVSPIMIPQVFNSLNQLVPLQLGVNDQEGYCSSNMWAIPPTHQIYIAPASSQFPNPPQNLVHHGDFHQNDSGKHYLKNQFNRFDRPHHKNYARKHYLQGENSRSQRWNYHQQKPRENLQNFDLRSFLCAKKTKRTTMKSQDETSEETDKEPSWNEKERVEDRAPVESHSVTEPKQEQEKEKFEDDSDWFEEHMVMDGTQLKVNVTNLKNLAPTHMQSERWYLVPDKDILLKHLNFFNILCNSDEQCHVMVPAELMRGLEENARDANNRRMANRAQLAITFLTQRLDAGSAEMGCGDSEHDNGNFLDSCLKLALQKYLVILLISENNELKTCRSSEIHIFTLKELRQLLSKPSPDRKLQNIEKSKRFSNKIVKITVTNEYANKPKDTTTITRVDNEVQVNLGSLPDNDNEPKATVSENVVSNTEKVTAYPNKLIKEAAVQTEIPTTSDEPASNAETNTSADSTEETAKKQKRLKRYPIKNPTFDIAANVEKMHFKWRKRKIGMSTPIDPQKDGNTSTSSETKLTANKTHIDVASSTFENDKSVPPQSPKESTKSENKFDDTTADSESSSCIVRKRVANDTVITIDETSTSGIISNTSVDEYDDYRMENLSFKRSASEHTDSVFQVTDPNIEDHLRIGRDEYVSRFVQIMEEVVTQILRQDDHFLKETVYKLYGGGPWILLEALECLEIKFRRNHSIAKAAFDLSSSICHFSDDKGRIFSTLRPSEYMQMYSNGVSLINSLQAELDDCEDLIIAGHSLLKLFADIKNPNTDSSNIDVFDDNAQDSREQPIVSEVPSPLKKEKASKPTFKKDSVTEQSDISDNNQSDAVPSYNLRSRSERSQDSVKKSQKVKLHRKKGDPKSVFMSNLNLKLNSNDKIIDAPNSDPLFASQSPEKVVFYDNSNNTNNISPNKEDISENTVCTNVRETETSKEDRPSYTRQPLDLDRLDYSGNDDEYEDESYMDYENKESCNDYEEDITETSKEDQYIAADTNAELENLSGQNKSSNEQQMDVDNNLRFIFNQMLPSVKEALIDINEFCEDSLKELNGSVYSSGRKVKLMADTDKMERFLNKLCTDLKNIYYRETCEPENSIRHIFKVPHNDELSSNDNLFDGYRIAISKCLEQANVLHEFIGHLKIAAEQKPVS